jgi:hypothetical protein
LVGRASIAGPRFVLDIEIGPDRPARPVIDHAGADGLIAQIPADLSIPDFLRRRRP